MNMYTHDLLHNTCSVYGDDISGPCNVHILSGVCSTMSITDLFIIPASMKGGMEPLLGRQRTLCSIGTIQVDNGLGGVVSPQIKPLAADHTSVLTQTHSRGREFT